MLQSIEVLFPLKSQVELEILADAVSVVDVGEADGGELTSGEGRVRVSSVLTFPSPSSSPFEI